MGVPYTEYPNPSNSFHSAHLSFNLCIIAKAKGFASRSVCDLPVIAKTHSYKPAYPKEIVE